MKKKKVLAALLGAAIICSSLTAAVSNTVSLMEQEEQVWKARMGQPYDC